MAKKDGHKDAVGAVGGDKIAHQQQSANRFDGGGEEHHHFDQPHRVNLVVGGDGFLREVGGAQVHAFADEEVEKAGQGNQPQPAQLNKGDDDRLPGPVEVDVGIVNNQSGYAGGRSCRKQRVQERGEAPCPVHKGQRQQQRSHQNEDGKARYNNQGRVFQQRKFLLPVQCVPHSC